MPSLKSLRQSQSKLLLLLLRLLLLHHFAEIVCPILPMLPLGTVKCRETDGNVVEETEGVLCGNHDRLRGILMASAKEAAFRKVNIYIVYCLFSSNSSLLVSLRLLKERIKVFQLMCVV